MMWGHDVLLDNLGFCGSAWSSGSGVKVWLARDVIYMTR